MATRWEGLRRFDRRLAAIPPAIKREAQIALRKSAEETAAMQRRLAPVDTGGLRDSIVVTPAGHQTPPYSQPGGSQVVPDNAVVITAGNAGVRYAHLVEYGTMKTSAQPFFWPPVRVNKKRTIARTKRAIRKAIKEAK